MRTAHEEFTHGGYLCVVKRVGTFGEWHAVADRFDEDGKVIGSLQTRRFGGIGAKNTAKYAIVNLIEKSRQAEQSDAG